LKKLLLILLCLPILFTTCKKEEEEPTSTGNNNSSLTFEETIWEVTSFEETSSSGQTWYWNIPVTDEEGWDTGINKIEWLFFNNEGFFVEKWVNGYNNTYYDTSSYCYDCFPNNNKITLTDYPEGGYGSIISEQCQPEFLNIIELTSSNLIVEFCDADDINDCYKVYLTKVN
jgi:hypothetical protein